MKGLGVVVPNVDMTSELSKDEIEAIEQASAEACGILVFPNQSPSLSMKQQVDFAAQFGPIEPHPVAAAHPEHGDVLEIVREAGARVVFGENWHSDFSFMTYPCSFSFLRATDCMPPRGVNDTLFSNTEAAFDALSPSMQQLLQGLSAYHSANKAYHVDSKTNSTAAMAATGSMRMLEEGDEKLRIMDNDVLHPLVVVHPLTGRRSVYASPTFTTHIDGMHQDESSALLDFLYRWIAKPQFCNRISWSPHQVTMWDNRSLLHRGLADDVGERRVVHRVSVRGNAPFGVHDAQAVARISCPPGHENGFAVRAQVA